MGSTGTGNGSDAASFSAESQEHKRVSKTFRQTSPTWDRPEQEMVLMQHHSVPRARSTSACLRHSVNICPSVTGPTPVSTAGPI